MSLDPAGLYERLGVPPTASAEAIATAFRRKARVLHPDIPITGNSDAFVQVKQAYDVLADPHRRAAYDRTARAAESDAPAVSQASEPESRLPRFSDLPLLLWVFLGGLFLFACAMALVELARSPKQQGSAEVRPFAPMVAPAPTAPPASAPAPMVEGATHYVLPGGGDAVMWRWDPAHDTFLPAGRLADFTAVQAIGVVSQHGLIEIRLADGSSGYVDASRLAPGGQREAHRAYCSYNAGPEPQNGEVLQSNGAGAGRLAISNHTSEPAVVKLREPSGRVAASVFLSPGGNAVLRVPDRVYRPDFAVGELWSRACNRFAAGMRAQRFSGYASVSGLSPLVIPPDLSVSPPPVDIPDGEFERD